MLLFCNVAILTRISIGMAGNQLMGHCRIEQGYVFGCAALCHTLPRAEASACALCPSMCVCRYILDAQLLGSPLTAKSFVN